ncbi:MAG: phosphoribosylamine--glycine ligase [Armatimonadota bacterium]|nr:phosphoribosylamine--glycine ligase [Armatimonadota bacterium]
MKVLVVGGGGREHALAWKIAQSPLVEKLYCAPGNPGMATVAERVDIKATDLKALADFAEANDIGLTVVGPESPLIAGIVDEFESRGLRIFGPCKAAAALEGSKAFTKDLLRENNIPTAAYETFSEYGPASSFVKDHFSFSVEPVVVKADGEAAGKGVYICQEAAEADEALRAVMVDRVFGESGNKAVVEEFLTGQEATIMGLVDGGTLATLIPVQDYKRVFDNDEGPNTGSMGCYAPVPVVTEDVRDFVAEKIMVPTMAALKRKGIVFKGMLYAGVILTDSGPKLLEYNVRFGDPETQVVLPLMESDLVETMLAVVEGRLDEIEIRWYNKKAVCVVIASGGYPGDYETGMPIDGLPDAESAGAIVFHAGTKTDNGKIVTGGGRVLGVTALGSDYREAIAKAYVAADRIHFDKMHMRRDIGRRLL